MADRDMKWLGRFYREEKVLDLLGITKKELDQRVERKDILRVTTSDHLNVYPVVQFEDDRIAHAIDVMLKQYHMNPWMILYTINEPLPQFDGKTAVESGKDIEDWQWE